MGNEMRSTKSSPRRWGTLHLPLDATVADQGVHGEVSVEISQSKECKGKGTHHFYRRTVLPIGNPHDDEEIATELGRYRAQFEVDGSISRNGNIGQITSGSLVMPREDYSANWRDKHSDHESSSSDADEDDIDDNCNTTANDADKIKTAGRRVRRDDSATAEIADAASAGTVSATSQAVLHLKLQDESIYASDGTCHEGEEQSRPASECSSEEFEDGIGDVRHVFEHVSNSAEGDHLSVSQCIKRIYLNQKWLRYQAQLVWDRDQRKGPAFNSPRIAGRPKHAFVDEWEVEEHIIVPGDHQDYHHISHLSSDLQQIDLGSRVSFSEEGSPLDYNALYQHDPAERDFEADDNQPVTSTSRRVRFKPYSMNTRHRASTPHFQLRNHFAVQDHLRYIYSSGNQVWSEYNWSSARINLMDFSNATPHAFANPVTISTLALSNDHPRSICMVGGLSGEFAYKSLLGCTDVLKASPITSGYITTAPSALTNHIEISSHPNHAIISSNDSHIRTLDLTTGHFLYSPSSPSRTGTLSGHTYPFPVNCTASCPDGRLRVAIGDHHTPLIIRADTGTIERELPGHSDHGFACAWSPDARYVATAAQDRIVNIYDTRMWRVCSRFVSYGSTCRSMRFSPVGAGPRCLLLAEEADRVSVVDMVDWERVQTIAFLGGIVGVDFERDGEVFWIANCDARFGGFMRWDNGSIGKPGAGGRIEFGEELEEDGEERGGGRTSGRRRRLKRQ